MSHLPRGARAFFRRRVWSLLVRGMSSSYADPLSAPLPHLSSARRRFPSAVRAAPRPGGENGTAHTMAREASQKTRTPRRTQ